MVSFLFPLWLRLKLFCWPQFRERAAQLLIYYEHGTVVVELVAVVGRREDRQQLHICEELVPVLHYLVPAHDQVEPVLVDKLLDHLLTEHIGGSAVIFAPAARFYARGEGLCPCRWVGPQQIAEQTGVWDLRRPLQLVDLLEVLQVWREPAMHAQDFVLNQCGNWESIK